MECDYCFLETHESKNCDYRVMKSYCFICHVKTDFTHFIGKKCGSNEECNSWFSTKHHLLFCRERLKAIKLFLPKIDRNLLQRFLETTDVDEKYLTILSSPITKKLFPLKHVQIRNTLTSGYESPKTPVIIVNSVNLSDSDMAKDKQLFDSIASKTLICHPREINIEQSNLSAKMLLQLLSPNTKHFSFKDSSCYPNLSFSDIIKNAPNLEYISIYNFETNIEYEKTWIKDLLTYKNGKNFKYLSIKIGAIEDFDIENMAKFIKIRFYRSFCNLKDIFIDEMLSRCYH